MAFDNNEQTIHGVGREMTDITITHIGYFKLEYICLIPIIFLFPSPSKTDDSVFGCLVFSLLIPWITNPEGYR